MALKPEFSIMAGLTMGALVYGVYNTALPPAGDIRTVQENNVDVDSANRLAGWTSAAVVAGISLIAKDATIFIIGGSMVVALNWWYKHANQVKPEIGRVIPMMSNESQNVNPDDMAQSENYDDASNY